MSMHYRWHRRKNGKNKPIAIILLLSLIGIYVITAFADYFITVSLIAIAVTALFIGGYCFYLYADKKIEEYVCTNSKAIIGINEINAKYKFHDVSALCFDNSYDNINFYDDISPTDFLIYRLETIAPSVRSSISCTNENKAKFETYKREVEAISIFELEAPKVLVGYIRKKEKTAFEELIQYPLTEYSITVRLNLTKINGYFLDNKVKTFTEREILHLLHGLSDKDGDFYCNRLIWDALCRVERGKVSNKLRFEIYERDGYRCRKCGSTENLEVDHIFPISKGGKTVMNNLQTLCHDCNYKKSDSVEFDAFNSYSKRHIHICPNCNVELVLRNGRSGKFYGCPNYPECKFTKDYL